MTRARMIRTAAASPGLPAAHCTNEKTLALAHARAHGLDLVVARAFGHTGPGQTARFVVPGWAQQVAAIEAGRAEPVLRVGNLAVTRDLSDVRDIVRGYAALLERGARHAVYNVCRGEGVGLDDLLRMLVVLAVTVGISLAFSEQLLQLLAGPVGGIDQLAAIEVTENLGVFMKVGLVAGIAVAIPYLAFEIWLFAAPGISPTARWMGLLGIPFATAFFYAGAAFAYFVML